MTICHRLFFALLPPAPALPTIARHRDRLAEITDKVINRRVHMTLAITNDCQKYSAALARELCAMGDEIASEPVEVSLNRLTGTPKSIALAPGRSSRALRALQAGLGERMVHAGLLRNDWKFSPHVTLGYRKGTPFNRAIDPIRWENDDFVLIHSEVGATRHNVVARWPLAWQQGRLF